MTSFILIPGAWTGAWIWNKVARGLRARNYDVYPVTLPGLEGQNLDTSKIGLDTHVEAVLSLLRRKTLRDVIVVGHGTSGILAGIAADRAPERVIHTVYVEGFLPHDGRSTLGAFAEPILSEELRSIAKNNGRWPAPSATVVGEGQDLSTTQATWIARGMVDHPGRPLTEPVRLRRALDTQQATYVVCEMDHVNGRLPDDVERMRSAQQWSFHTLETGVWPMISASDDLVALLDQTANPPCAETVYFVRKARAVRAAQLAL